MLPADAKVDVAVETAPEFDLRGDGDGGAGSDTAPRGPYGWLLPDWPAPEVVGTLVTTRHGGVSVAPFHMPLGKSHSGGLNLGFHTGDSPEAVTENRRRVAACIGNHPIAWLEQVHGTRVADARDVLHASPALLSADAVVTDQAGIACAVMVADCLPVLFCSLSGRAVGAAHAGWRGLVSGVLENTVTEIRRLAADEPVMAYLGPAIGATAFEVGKEVREAFVQASSPIERAATIGAFVEKPPTGGISKDVAAESMASPSKYLGDLAALARLRLQRVGVTAIFGGTDCTYNDAARFYSYRRDGQTGRQAALIWRKPDAY